MAFPNDPEHSYNPPSSDGDWTGGTAAYLVIERGDANQTERPILRPVYVIGTAADCDMVLGDAQFSDYHAYIYVRDGIVTLRHLGPAPEITVNGRVVRWGELKHMDRLRFGPYQLQLRLRPSLKPRKPAQQKPTSTYVHDFRWDMESKPWMPKPTKMPNGLPEENRFTEHWK